MTLLLTRSTVEAALQIDEALAILSRGFCETINQPRPQRIRTDLPGPGTATCLIPGLLSGIPAYTVKVNAKFPASSPALRGVVCLHDLDTGDLLALVDSASVTAWRTGLSAALGTHVLADPAARTLGFVGAGAQARMVAAGLRTLRSFDETVATDLDRRRAADLADVVVDDARAVAARCEIVILATWSRVPLLHAEDIATVAHLTTLGADEPGKIELAADVLEVGVAYVRFAVDHRAHFDVMFRPDLYHPDDPEVAAARERAADALYGGVGSVAVTGRGPDIPLAGVAAWSLVHGFATLWLNHALPATLGDDPETAARGVAAILFRTT